MAVGDVEQGYVTAGNEDRWVQCGYNSINQGPLHKRGKALDELDWTLRELAVLPRP